MGYYDENDPEPCPNCLGTILTDNYEMDRKSCKSCGFGFVPNDEVPESWKGLT